MKSVIEECAKQVPLTFYDRHERFKKVRRMIKPFAEDLWGGLKEKITSFISQERIERSKLNRLVDELFTQNKQVGAQVVWSLVVYTAGVQINLILNIPHSIVGKVAISNNNVAKRNN
ncbi:MAG: hypothetical protein IC227_03210 [Enterococcus lacertideformus]|uniref:Uncharacterized protein n=1 Tax=Enterococcus lacertideformus TaxID=2771493 RepID=A0A931AUY5_9ENTE|nr:hypothetical protein [Enterococcus lacertideformus]